ncbi:hypothetical protein MXB_899 [Myxobolus squamalis]|nr:hypothetical protein MXB_899 [Myxobolus squamalis]
MNLISKIHKNLLAVERQEMLTKYNKLIKPTQKKLWRPLEFCNRLFAGFYESIKTLHYYLLKFIQAEKEEEWGKTWKSRLH